MLYLLIICKGNTWHDVARTISSKSPATGTQLLVTATRECSIKVRHVFSTRLAYPHLFYLSLFSFIFYSFILFVFFHSHFHLLSPQLTVPTRLYYFILNNTRLYLKLSPFVHLTREIYYTVPDVITVMLSIHQFKLIHDQQ